MKITIYGTGCPKCRKLMENAEQAVRLASVDAQIEKVDRAADIARAGVLFTPGIAVDGEIKATGKVPDVDTIAGWLRAS